MTCKTKSTEELEVDLMRLFTSILETFGNGAEDPTGGSRAEPAAVTFSIMIKRYVEAAIESALEKERRKRLGFEDQDPEQ